LDGIIVRRVRAKSGGGVIQQKSLLVERRL
jgi:hypothetical protein